MAIESNETEESPIVAIPQIDLTVPPDLQTATFALGWFWGPEAQFGIIKGIYRTRVGYTGGTLPSPTYRNMGDHTEAMQVDFNPGEISFLELAHLFWNLHNPCATPYSRQYMSAIWYHDSQQLVAIEQSMPKVKVNQAQQIETVVAPMGEFYLAEDYHQKYRLQSCRELMKKFKAMYPNFEDFNNSTASTRLNGFASGHGTAKMFESESDQYGFERDELNFKLRS